MTGRDGIEARGIVVELGGRRLLDQVDLRIPAGEVTSLIGPNGAGKSTALAVLAGDLSPTAGHVTIAGRPIGDVGVRALARERSVLLQQPTVAFAHRVREVVRMGRFAWRGTPRSDEDDAVVDAALEGTESIALADREATALSGGELGRVSLARVLAQEAPVVLLDEPTAAMDVRHQEATMRLARECADAGCAVGVVSHDLDAAASWSDRVVLLADGRVVAAGDPASVMTTERLSAVYRHPIEVFAHPRTGRPVVRPVRGHDGPTVSDGSAPDRVPVARGMLGA